MTPTAHGQAQTLTFVPDRLPLPMQQQPIAFAVHGWLKTITLDRLVELWWMAQNERAAEEEKRQRRAADPDDMAYKPAEYVEAYYAAKRQVAG